MAPTYAMYMSYDMNVLEKGKDIHFKRTRNCRSLILTARQFRGFRKGINMARITHQDVRIDIGRVWHCTVSVVAGAAIGTVAHTD